MRIDAHRVRKRTKVPRKLNLLNVFDRSKLHKGFMHKVDPVGRIGQFFWAERRTTSAITVLQFRTGVSSQYIMDLLLL